MVVCIIALHFIIYNISNNLLERRNNGWSFNSETACGLRG
jgi:hypothetical protein